MDGTIIKVGAHFYAGNLFGGGSRLSMNEKAAVSFFPLESAVRMGVKVSAEYPGRTVLINFLGRDFSLRHWENLHPEWYAAEVQ